MGNVFFKGICQIGVFMICAQTFVHFCPKGAYEKYLKMLVSIMVLVQILSPLGTIFTGEGKNLENVQMGEWLGKVLMQSMDEVLQEGSFQLESIEESLASDAWQNGIQETTSDSIEQPTGNIYIEPVAPIRVGQ